MRTILCFGDSNTWGYVPGTDGERFPYGSRMPGILQSRLGPGFRVVEEDLNGRMSVWDDPMSPDRNARDQLPSLLETHRPLDLVAIMLGTNDMKAYMNLGPHAIAPPLVVETPTPFGHIFDGAIPKSQALAAAYREVAAQKGCLLLDAGSAVRTSARDGIHLDAEGHGRLAEAIAEVVRREWTESR